MKKNIILRLALAVLAVLIVLPVNSSVKQLSSNRIVSVSNTLRSGSPLPFPTPPARTAVAVSGSPLPFPTPPARTTVALSGSPLPFPTPPARTDVAVSGSPLPFPTPPALLA
jgi:ABC-type Fe3+-hydroxamate transport system substrate-binding protein